MSDQPGSPSISETSHTTERSTPLIIDKHLEAFRTNDSKIKESEEKTRSAFRGGNLAELDVFIDSAIENVKKDPEDVGAFDTATRIIDNLSKKWTDKHFSKIGELLTANPALLHTRSATDTIRGYVQHFKDVGITEATANLGTLLEVASSEESPIDKTTKDQLRTIKDLKTGFEMYDKSKTLLYDSKIMAGYNGASNEQLNELTGFSDEDKINYDSKKIDKPFPWQIGEKLSLTAKDETDPDKKRRLQLLALGVSIAASKKETSGTSYNGARDNLMNTLVNLCPPNTSVSEIWQREEQAKYNTGASGSSIDKNKPTPSEDLLIIEMVRATPTSNEILNKQHLEVLKTRDAAEAVTKLKEKEEAVRAVTLAAEVQAEAKKRAQETEAQRIQTLKDSITVSLNLQEIIPDKFLIFTTKSADQKREEAIGNKIAEVIKDQNIPEADRTMVLKHLTSLRPSNKPKSN